MVKTGLDPFDFHSTEVISVRLDYFDASALVKVFTNEERSDVVRDYFYRRGSRTTTQFCFYETLSVLKGKTRRKSAPLAWDDYLFACQQVIDFYCGHVTDEYEADPIITSEGWAQRALDVARAHKVDLSDALQILSVKHGVGAGFVNRSQSILVTADKLLADAAVKEGLLVWFTDDDLPADAHDHSLWALRKS